MGRADRVDAETARLVEERLERLLNEHPPHRASPAPSATDRPAERSAERSAPALGSPERMGGDRAGPEPLARVLEFSRAHLGLLAVLAVVALLGAGWTVLRARPVALAGPVGAAAPASVSPAEEGPPAAGPSRGTTPTASSSPAALVVHVLGAVRRPGLVRLPDGSRVQDAIEAAGGLHRNADPGELNLAQPVRDGQQVVVGTTKDPAGEVRNGGSGPGSAADPSGGADGTAPVDLNTATPEHLEALPGVGPVTAAKIIAWRTAHGRFSRVEELQEVSGIGPKTYAEIAPHCRV